MHWGGGLLLTPAQFRRNWAGGQKAVFYDIARIFRTLLPGRIAGKLKTDLLASSWKKCAENAPTAYTENKQSIYRYDFHGLFCFILHIHSNAYTCIDLYVYQ